VEEIIDRLGIETIRPKLELYRTVCASLASELENPRLTITERSVIAVEWGQMVKEGDILAFFADLLRRRERERKPSTRKIGHYSTGCIRASLKSR
jgi:hypothetical protein